MHSHHHKQSNQPSPKKSETITVSPPVRTSGQISQPGLSGQSNLPSNSKANNASESDIRERAYRKWEAAGRPPGNGVQFWLEAETELKRK